MSAQGQKPPVPRTETSPGAEGRGSHKGIPKDSLKGLSDRKRMRKDILVRGTAWASERAGR